MRRVSCASTRRSSMSRVSPSARSIAGFVISWNTIRRTGTFGFSTWTRCQAIASPSRSSSVASSSCVGRLELRLQVAHDRLLLRVDDVERLEVVVDVDAEPRPRLLLRGGRNLRGALREVADMADRRLDHVVLPEVPRDRLRLRWRLDDHEAAPLFLFLSHFSVRHCSHGVNLRDTRPLCQVLSRPGLLLAVDGDNFAHRAYHALPKTIKRAGGRPGGALVGFGNALLRLWDDLQPVAVVAAWDSLAVPNFRSELLPGYQAGRVFDDPLLEQLDLMPGLVESFGFVSAQSRRVRGRRLPRRGGGALARAGRRRLERPRRVPARQRPGLGPAAGEGRRVRPGRARRGPGAIRGRRRRRCRTSSRSAATSPTGSRVRRASARSRRPRCSTSTAPSRRRSRPGGSRRSPTTCGSTAAWRRWTPARRSPSSERRRRTGAGQRRRRGTSASVRSRGGSPSAPDGGRQPPRLHAAAPDGRPPRVSGADRGASRAVPLP